MPIQVDTIAGSAYWASYLINGDASGLEEHERQAADHWCEMNGIANVVDCGEQYYSNSYGLNTYTRFTGGDLVDYTVHLKEE